MATNAHSGRRAQTAARIRQAIDAKRFGDEENAREPAMGAPGTDDEAVGHPAFNGERTTATPRKSLKDADAAAQPAGRLVWKLWALKLF